MHVWSFEIGLLEHSGAYGTEEHGGTWHGRSSTGYAKEEGEAILKTSSTIYSIELRKSKSNPKNAILHMEVMEIAGKGPLRAPITLALEMEFIGVGWISLSNDPMASKA
ncbi:unnamed protein product [Microthlaspi erraticum]|uniref:Uncharacterized protein n=1 Tax=Microthlaspi erraticum TaxID=1685480 RepID=A0A6D2KCQ1_9BRAS|nr:unnamed protein product [Microthlaspi erraticum]